jgi:hypothetical protein
VDVLETEVTGGCSKLHDEKLYSSHLHLVKIRVMESGSMKWAGYVAHAWGDEK